MKVSRLFAVLIAALMIGSAPAVVLADYEPNDSINDAEWTYGGDTLTGTLDETSDASDFYYLYISSGYTLELTLSGTGSDFDLYVYDESETLLDSSTGGTSSEYINYLTSNSGDYYIEVYASSGSGDYTLEVETSYSYIPPSGGGGAYYVGGPDYVDGQPLATLPTLNVGDSAYFGGIRDIGDEFKPQIDEALQEIENYGMDVKYDISGGAGAYFGWKVASNTADVNGDTCYDIALTGAVAVDIGIEGSVDGSVSEGGYSITVDGSADGYVMFEATLDGHLYLTVDELAIAKLTLAIEAEGEMKLNADVSASGVMSMDANIEATGTVDGAKMNFELTFDPPMDVFQFGTGSGSTEGIYQGKQWYVPGESTDASGTMSAQGTVEYKVDATITGEDPVHESESLNLATEIGSQTFSQTIPGGEPDYWYGDGGIMFECTYASGDIFIIETAMGDALGIIDTGSLPFPGTRQFGDIDSMMPEAGMQLEKGGLVTGMTMGGETMTDTSTEAEVQSFTEDPLGEVTSETGGHSGGLGSMLVILVVVVVIVVVVVVVLLVVMRKKTPPPQQYPPQQPMYGPQPGYEQPPPQYQPQQQYPPQQGQYPPPPPPPPGQ